MKTINSYFLLSIFLGATLTSCSKFSSEKKLAQTPENGRVVAMGKEGKKLSEKEWHNKLPDGIWREFNNEELLVREYSWKEGKKSGSWKNFYDNGQLATEEHYQNDLLEGESTSYYPNGKKSFHGVFHHGNKSGFFSTWNPDGSKILEEKWLEGAKILPKRH